MTTDWIAYATPAESNDLKILSHKTAMKITKGDLFTFLSLFD